MPFTEFCCRSGGSNLNAGTRTGNSTEPGTSADFTYTSGNWVASTGVFTVASGNPSSDGVAVGDFASVYADGSTVTGFVGRVTAVSTTTITVSLTAKAGTAPTDGTGNRTLKIGGAWKGPNGTDIFPFNLATPGSLKNASGDATRWNLKNDATFSVSASIVIAAPGDWTTGMTVQGYSSSYGDLGKATISGGTGAGFNVISMTNLARWNFFDLIVTASHSSGTNNGFNSTGGGAGLHRFVRCVSHGHRTNGFTTASNGHSFVECEAYGNGSAGFVGASADDFFDHCISHDNTGNGFTTTVPTVLNRCIADSNGGAGFSCTGAQNTFLLGCDAYNNTGNGATVSGTNDSVNLLKNCNFVKNGGYGISFVASAVNQNTQIHNCGFGSGTQANTSGQIQNQGNAYVVGSVTYASNVTPWVDPANGDFRISLAAAKCAGRGAFTQTAASYSGTVGYPDIGSAQHQDSGGGGVRQVNIRGGADQ